MLRLLVGSQQVLGAACARSAVGESASLCSVASHHNWPAPAAAIACSAQSALQLQADDAIEAALKRANDAEALATEAADQAALAAARVSCGCAVLVAGLLISAAVL